MKILKLTLLNCFLLMYPIHNYSQTVKSDSLKSELINSIEDTAKLKILVELYEFWDEINLDTARQYIQQVLKIGKRINNNFYLGKAYHGMGDIASSKGNWETAMENFKTAAIYYDKAQKPKGKLRIINNIGITYRSLRQFDSAFYYFDKGGKIAEEIGDDYMVGMIQRNKGRIFQFRREFEESLVLYQKSKKKFEEISDSSGIAAALLDIGNIYYERKNYQKALTCYDSALTVATSNNLLHTSAVIRNSKGALYIALGETELGAREYFEATEYHHKAGNLVEAIIGYGNIGNLYLRQEDYPLAKKYYFKEKSLVEKAGTALDSSYLYNHLGVLYKNEKNIDSAIVSLKLAINASKKAKTNINLASAYNNLGEVFLENEDIGDSANYYFKIALDLANESKSLSLISTVRGNMGNLYMVQEEYYKAIQEFKFVENNSPEFSTKVKANGDLSTAYSKIQDYKEAFQYQHRYSDLKDSLMSIENRKNINGLEVKFSTQQIQDSLKIRGLQVESLNLEQQRQSQFTWGILVILGLIGIFSGILYKNNGKIKSINSELEQQNQLVKSLFNELNHRTKNNLFTIENILELHSRDLEDKSAKEALQKGKSRVQSISLIHKSLMLKEENGPIEIMLDSYLKELSQNVLQMQSFSSEEVELNAIIEPLRLPVEQILPLGLIVNEIITNSCKYAFPHTNNPKFNIEVKEMGQKLVVIASDNGPGLNHNPDTDSFGIQLIQSMVEQLDAKLDLDPDQGTKYTLEIPLRIPIKI